MIRFARSSSALALAVLLVPFAASCGDDGPTAPRTAPVVAAVTIAPAPITLTSLGSTARMTASAVDEDGKPMPGARFVWQSSDPTVAVVDTAGLVLAKAPGSAIVSAVAGGIPGHASVTVTQTAASLAFITQPTDATAGAAFSPAVRVEIRDAQGARVRAASDAVALLIEGDGTLAGTTTVNASDGVATFVGVSLDRAGHGLTLAAVAAELDAATSAPFDVAPAAATALAFDMQPADVVAGDTVRVRIGLRDAFGNAVGEGVDTVYLRLEDPADTLYGIPGGTMVDGVVTIDVLIHRADSAHRLIAEASGRPAAVSESFVVRAGEPALLEFLTQPTDVAAGETFEIDVAVIDAYGNTTDVDSMIVALALAPNERAAALSGWDSVTTTDGIATFAVSVLMPAVDLRLLPSAGSLLIDSSSRFDVFVRFSQISAGFDHTCGVSADYGVAYCWGDNQRGALGDGSTQENASYPVPVATSLRFSQVSAGADFTCGVARGSGAAWCWGDQTDGRLGNGSTSGRSTVPAPVDGERSYSKISAGSDHSCAIDAAEHAWCWGANGTGQLGDGTLAGRGPVAVAGDHLFQSIDAGDGHTCAVSNITSWCWGSNTHGELGDGSTVTRTLPTELTELWFFDDVTVGADYTCGIGRFFKTDDIICWGSNLDGVFANGTTSFGDSTAVQTVTSLQLDQLDAGDRHACVVSNGRVYCWGAGDAGRIGNGTAVTSMTPAAVLGLEGAVAVTAGGRHSCALTGAGEAYCWGEGSAGQLGDGLASASYVPVRVGP